MPIPTGFVQSWLRFTIAGDPEPMYTAFGHVVQAPPFVQANANDLIDRLQDLIRARICDDYVLDGGFCLAGAAGGDIRFDVTQQQTGAVVATPLPQNCAALFRVNTALGGRANRGRRYIPGISTAEVSATGILTTAAQTNWQTTGDALATPGLGGVGNMNVGGPVLFHLSNLAAPTDITSFDIQPRIATQRRRLRP